MSTYKDYVLYEKLGRFFDKSLPFIPYIFVVAVMVFLWNILVFDDMKKIYLIDKSVISTHTNEKTYCTYHMSFYYSNETDVIYHHKKQPSDIWKQIYFHKNNSFIDLNLGKNGWGILLLCFIYFICIVFIFIYTMETFA